MPMTERFYSVNGQMMGYESGGVKKDFLTDHLGSITAEIDQTQTRTFDTRYSAYGRNNWSTGTGCGFGWVGSYGYRETGLFHMSHYVRARHYSYVTGGWSTVDPLWPGESAYGYVRGRTSRSVDPTGRNWRDCPKPNPFEDAFNNLKAKVDKICSKPKPTDPSSPVYKCWKDAGEPDPGKEAECFCNHATGKKGYGIDFKCYDDEKSCMGSIGGQLDGYCMGALKGGFRENCEIRICPRLCGGVADYGQAFFHEIMHCCGAEHGTNKKPDIKKLEDCLRREMGWPPIVWPPRAEQWPGNQCLA